MEHVGIRLHQRDGKTVAVNTRGEMLTFYSMRHRFHELLDNSDVSRKRQLVLTGHASQEDHDKYARGANLLKLYNDVAKLDRLADLVLDEQVDRERASQGVGEPGLMKQVLGSVGGSSASAPEV